jgi:hypothetical protein
MLQSTHSATNRNFIPVERDYARTPPKPCLDGEPAYEYPPDALPAHRPVGERQVRRNAYWAVFAGACGHTYGTHPVWQMYDDGTSGSHPPKTRKPLWDVVTPWHQALALPGAMQLQHLKRLMLSRPFLERIPDQSPLLSPCTDDTSRIQVTRDRGADGGATYLLAYFPHRMPATFDLTIFGGRSLRVWWFNPRNGDATAWHAASRGSPASFTPPGETEQDDWVLVLDDAESNYAPPGTLLSPPISR